MNVFYKRKGKEDYLKTTRRGTAVCYQLPRTRFCLGMDMRKENDFTSVSSLSSKWVVTGIACNDPCKVLSAETVHSEVQTNVHNIPV